MSKNISVAKTILAILWTTKSGTIKFFDKHPYFNIFCKGKSKKTRLSSLSRLKKRGLILSKGKNFLLATEGKDEAVVAFIRAETILHSHRQHIWDGKWRIVFFDIPEERRRYRDYLRKTLKLLGFKELQRSIWIYPYLVPSFLKNLLFGEEIRQYVRFVTTEHIDNDQELRTQFKLS